MLLALGKLAHDAVLRVLGLRLSSYRFMHGGVHALTGKLSLVDSYHCSRYNTQTRRLTPEMFGQIFLLARQLLDSGDEQADVCGSG